MPQLQTPAGYSDPYTMIPSWTNADANVYEEGDGSSAVANPLANPSTANAEFGDVGQFVTDVVTKAQKNASRLLSTAQLSINPQGESAQRPWYDLIGKAKDSLSAAGSAVSSTLTKVIILVVVVAIIALFGLSFVQAKAGQLAK